MKRFRHQLGLSTVGLLAILLIGAFAGPRSATTAPRVAVGVTPAHGGARTTFVGTFIVPTVAAGHVVDAALIAVKTTGPFPCNTGDYVPFSTPTGQRAHVAYTPPAGSTWCPGTYHVQVSSFNPTTSTSKVLGSSKIVRLL